MSKLSDFRELVLGCVTDEWQTLREIANHAWWNDNARKRIGSGADYAYRCRVENALWHWLDWCNDPTGPTRSGDGWRVQMDHTLMGSRRDWRWRRTQEDDHA